MSWNKSFPRSVHTCFHQHFEDIAQKMPDAPAICSWDGNFTYRELDTLSTKLANHLAELGVAPEMLVPICFDKSSFAIVSMLGILKAGGAFVAIDPSYPASRIQAIIKATNASIVVAEPAHCHLFEGIMKRIVAIDPKLADELPRAPGVARPQPCPSNTAYVVFTSGSTGAPKGIMVEHRALCTAVLALAAPMRITSTSRFLQFAAYTFDLSYGDIFVTLSQGGCICVPSEHERVNDLVGAIVRMNVNVACLIPSVARMFRPEDVPCLETLLLGGEALVQENLELWAAKVALVNLYGPSECTIWCTAQTDLKVDSRANNIGRGRGALLWITSITNHDRLCPIGCIGELLIEGPVLARGYLDDEQTKLSFVENPSWAEAESGQRRRFYKTGDLVRYNTDGTVSFIGRKDTQIKLHGRRIEMGEIEYHLSSHYLLRQSMVTLPAAGIYCQRLVAIVVLKTSKASKDCVGELKPVTGIAKEISTSELAKIKNFLSSRVPSYMLPRFWVVVEDIPLMTSGKMNRVLAKRFVESLTEESPEEMVDVWNTNQDLDDPVEIRLRNIWSDVLDKNVTKIGVEQSFLSLGGDSFSAMDLVARCKAEGLSLTVHEVLSDSTIRQMASIVKKPSPGAAMIGRDVQEVSRVQDNSSVHVALKLPPIWWDARSALVGSGFRVDLR
jgi:amino acid adenylation domain-containing protein